LQGAGFDWEDVFIGPSFASLRSAVTAGLGVMAITRRRAEGSGMAVWEDTPLPKLADLYSGIYVREGGARGIYEQLADDIAAAIFEPAESATELPASLAPTLKANSAA
jgi:hypothetical protein